MSHMTPLAQLTTQRSQRPGFLDQSSNTAPAEILGPHGISISQLRRFHQLASCSYLLHLGVVYGRLFSDVLTFESLINEDPDPNPCIKRVNVMTPPSLDKKAMFCPDSFLIHCQLHKVSNLSTHYVPEIHLIVHEAIVSHKNHVTNGDNVLSDTSLFHNMAELEHTEHAHYLEQDFNVKMRFLRKAPEVKKKKKRCLSKPISAVKH